MRVRADDGIWNQALKDKRRQWEKGWVLERTRKSAEKNSWVETERSWSVKEKRRGVKKKRGCWNWRN